MRAHRTIAGISPSSVFCVLATAVSLLAAGLSAARANAQTADTQGDSTAASSPCLQELNDQKANAAKDDTKASKGPGWFSRNAGAILGGIGAVGGAVIGDAMCKKAPPQQRLKCMALGGAGGALLGSTLGKLLSEAEKKRYQEATYKVALTGRPQSLTLEKGCMVVEPASDETFEERQVELAFGSSIATPQKLRSVAMPYVRPSSASVSADLASIKGVTKVDANVPSFVMGSTDSGKYLLLGREDPDQGFVGAGYVDAKGWVASPDSTPASIADTGGQPKLVNVGVEVSCRKISSSIRVEASNKTETYPGKVCRLPNGISESQ